MNTNNITRGELVLALAMFRKLNQENQQIAIALVEALKESQSESDGLKETTRQTQ